MEVKQLIQTYLQDAKMMHLATVSNGKPWVCNVWFATDDSMSIYYFSATTTRHSAEVMEDPYVAGSMCLPQTPQDKSRGLQFEGVASLLTDEGDVQKTISVYKDRIFSSEQIEQFIAHPDRPHRFYRIKPELFVLFDAEHFPKNARQEFRLS